MDLAAGGEEGEVGARVVHLYSVLMEGGDDRVVAGCEGCDAGVFVGEEDGWGGEDLGVDFAAEFGREVEGGEGFLRLGSAGLILMYCAWDASL